MGRKSIETTADLSPQPVLEVAPEYVEAVNTMATIDAEVAAQSEEVYDLGSLSGRMEMAAFFANISDLAVLSTFENMKKSKAWRNLKSAKTGNAFPTFDDFCQEKLGYGERRLRQISGNKNLLGQDAFEQAERIGLRQVDYNLIKTLPAPKQEIVKDALAEGATKEELQKAIRELAAADQKEIDSLTKERDSARARLVDETETNERIILSKNEKIDKLDRELHRLQRSIELPSWPDQVPELNIQSMSLIGQVQILLSRLEAQREAIMAVDFGDRAGEPEAVSAMESMAMTYVRGLEDCFNQLADLAHAGRTVFDLWPTGEDGEGELLFFGNAAAQDDEQEGI